MCFAARVASLDDEIDAGSEEIHDSNTSRSQRSRIWGGGEGFYKEAWETLHPRVSVQCPSGRGGLCQRYLASPSLPSVTQWQREAFNPKGNLAS